MKDKWQNRIIGHGEEAPDQLLANSKNWRLHPKQQQEPLHAALETVGWLQDILVNVRSGETWPPGERNIQTVVDGHLRITLALRHNQPSVPVKYVDLSPDEEAIALATLDPITALAVADKEKLDALLREMPAAMDARLTEMLAEMAKAEGLYPDTKGGEAPEPEIDRAGELQGKWATERGQIWEIPSVSVPGKCHRVMCGDSTNKADVKRLMGVELGTLVVTDPPYGVDYDGGTKKTQKLLGDNSTALYEPTCKMAFDFTDENAALYLFHAGVKGYAAAAAAAAAGYEIRCELIWNKNQAQFGALSAQYKQKHEPFYYCFKRNKTVRWFGPTNEITVWDCDRSSVNEYHPTQKPPVLIGRAISNSSESSSLVLDFFLGSGTTMVAAEQLGRLCYGCEIEPRYVAVVLERMAAMGLEPRLEKNKK